MKNKEPKTKTVELTGRECSQIRAFIILGIWEYEEQWIKSIDDGAEDYELKAKVDYYRALTKKFEWR